MVEAQNKIVSIATFRATRPVDRATGTPYGGRVWDRPSPSARSIEHRERMLQFLRLEALARKQDRQVRGRLLL